MKITIGTGIDELKFGMKKSDIFALLKMPDKTYKDDYGDRFLLYYDLDLVLKIEIDHNNRLGLIEVQNPNVTLFGSEIIGKSQRDVLEFINQHLEETPEKDDFNSFESFFYEENWLELQFELGKLKSICFGVLYDRNDQPIWP